MRGASFALVGLVVAALFVPDAGCGAGEDRIAVSEGALAAQGLALDNQRLRAEVAKLEEQVRQLTMKLAEAVAELDVAKAREGQALAGPAQTVDRGIRATEARVVDVNAALRLVVLDAGRQSGVTPGTVYAVVREDRVVNRVRVVDVRSRIAGAEWVEADGARPERGDRLVLDR